MKEGPDIALIGALIGDPARANMLAALMSGKALTASELAAEAGIGAPTASAHLKRLEEGGLVRPTRQGRHRYFALTGADVGAVLEALMGLAARRGHLRTRTGPADPALRKARVCYDPLAGDLGVQLYESLAAQRCLVPGEVPLLTGAGRALARNQAIDIAALEGARRPLCRACLDWSARRSHLAGSLGAAFLARFEALGWARRVKGSRAVRFSASGEAAFRAAFPL
jgi:DNA-binding transcriptional ArsR family regulator